MCRSYILVVVVSVVAAGLLSLTGCQATSPDAASAAPRLGDTRVDENGQAWRLIDDMGHDDPYPERRWVRIERLDQH